MLAESAAAILKADDQEGKETDDTQRKGNRNLVVTESNEAGYPKNRQVYHSNPLLQYRICTVSRMHLTCTARVVPKYSRRQWHIDRSKTQESIKL